MPFDISITPPTYVAPNRGVPEVLVDQYRIMLVDNEGNMLGIEGNHGAAGRIGRLVYATRALSNRGY